MRISKQQSPIKDTINLKQPENVEYFKYLGCLITSDERRVREIKSRNATAKAAFRKNKKGNIFIRTLEANLRKKLMKINIWSIALKPQRFRKYIRTILKGLKCCDGEGRRIYFGRNMLKMKMYSTKKETSYIQCNERRLTVVVTFTLYSPCILYN
jgi:hypothetical protein